MGYTVEADANLRSVVVRHDHPMADSYLQSRDELIALVRETGYRRALVVLEGPGFGLDAFRVHDHVAYLAARLPHGTRLAVVIVPDEDDRISGDFAEVVGDNRGLTLKIFEDERRAIAWLERVPPAPSQEERADP